MEKEARSAILFQYTPCWGEHSVGGIDPTVASGSWICWNAFYGLHPLQGLFVASGLM